MFQPSQDQTVQKDYLEKGVKDNSLQAGNCLVGWLRECDNTSGDEFVKKENHWLMDSK